ncbi:MAG: N-acetylornithine carbamoyltransferase [Saprospiraceae bacterium]|nr:N-acetylornithine carbamoyltransferase [Saprospiraceae bacterium]
MNHFISLQDVEDKQALLRQALSFIEVPWQNESRGFHKTLGMLFFNPSLRTRLSTQQAAYQLGMKVISMNADQGWKIEFEDGVIMNADKAEHVREAAAVMSQLVDMIAIRSFPGLIDRDKDYREEVMTQFVKFATVPIINLESSTLHPLQSFADIITIEQYRKASPHQTKVVLTWAPHIRALPQAVSNSFAQWALGYEYDLVIAHPEGYRLNESFTRGARIEYDQRVAFEGADFIYAKNWSSYEDYGKVLSADPDWMITKEKMALTNQGKIMHCLPTRRNLEIADEVLDSPNSLVVKQAKNRIFAAQAVLNELLVK